MSWSIGEVRALSMKAARGAGMVWGLAEETGFAVEWLETKNAPGVEALARYLDQLPEGKGVDTEVCPIAVGAGISDYGCIEDDFQITIHQPLLILPFLALIAVNESLEISWQDHKVVVNETGISGGVPLAATSIGPFSCSVRKGVVSTPSLPRVHRVSDDRKAFMDILGRFAHKTYAPATDASRASGAGAGINDND